MEEGTGGVSANEAMRYTGSNRGGIQQQQQQQFDNYPPGENNPGASSPQGQGTVADSIFSNPSMVSGGGSISSADDDYDAAAGVRLDPL